MLPAAQAERKLDVGRADTAFKAGGRVLPRTKSVSCASGGSVTVIACPRPNAYTGASPRTGGALQPGPRDRLRPVFALAGGISGSWAGV